MRLLPALLLVATAAFAAGPVEMARFAIERQYHVAEFLACEDVVVAVVSRARTGNPPGVVNQDPVLVAWNTDGTVRWQRELHSGLPGTFARCYLERAGAWLAIANTDDTSAKYPTYGLSFLDLATGTTVATAALDGEPMCLTYYPREQRLVALVVLGHGTPDRQEQVRAYTLDAREAWRLTETHWSYWLECRGSQYLVVRARGKGSDTLTRVDPATGAVLWRRADAFHGGDGDISGPVDGTIALASRRGSLLLLDPDTGVTRRDIPYRGQQPYACGTVRQTADRVDAAFVAADGLGLVLAAVDPATGEATWSRPADTVDTYGTCCAFWNNRVALVTRHMGQLAYGRSVDRTALRIYDGDGGLLTADVRVRPGPPGPDNCLDDLTGLQTVGERLYLVDTKAIVALAWR